MSTRARIHQSLETRCQDRAVAEVRIGLGYTAVMLDDGRLGLAYTFTRPDFAGCSVFDSSRPLAGRPVEELLGFLLSDDAIESGLGLATANALANVGADRGRQGDVLDALEVSSSDRVGMIGFFGPLVPVLEGRVRSLEIFEERDRAGGTVLPAAEALKRLPECDIALITSTSIVNNTIDPLLEAASLCRETVLLGSSTPMLPEAFRGTPVTCLSGITVNDAGGILRVVSEGGGTRFFKPFVTKWNLFTGERA
jgi:uncharacterized protein (DUF4213/DUF364 family)